MFIKCEYACVNNENLSPGLCSMCDYLCVRTCVTKRDRNKWWKPSKPEGVIGLSTWIFDWREIKNSVRGNYRNKRGKTSHETEPGRGRGGIGEIRFEWLRWILTQIRLCEIGLIFCRLTVKFKQLEDVLREKRISVYRVLQNALMVQSAVGWMVEF